MSKYLENVKKYVDSPNENAVEALVGHLGLALESRDSAVVAATDDEELARIKTGYCSKTLDLSSEEADKALAAVCEKMKGDTAKCRVTFYYLLAEASDSMDRLAA
ncbi:DUF2853 family protein [Rhodopirellula sallentina]|uniref:DUF2853 family protein n=1 Tax=Rhodopirellula sallentina SM41 TaxID=1263870 RepID=M5TXA9_9BACT|nr:DUF2853 family protein [Rhodopirellula sallentina]EMI53815.1 hypothetical protein RSSM_04752 [Rhodopirellula sallentina SM41]